MFVEKISPIKKFTKKHQKLITVVVSATLSSAITAALMTKMVSQQKLHLALYREEIGRLLDGSLRCARIKTPRGDIRIGIKDL